MTIQPQLRKSRFHTESGQLCLAPWQLAFSLSTTLLRKYAGYYAPMPWLVLPAIQYLKENMRGGDLFEFGSGTSTAWFSKRCRRVWSVEHSPEWHRRQKFLLEGASNVTLIFEPNEERYVSSARRVGRSFDVVIVDGIRRSDCLENSIDLVRSGGILLADNTDQQPELKKKIYGRFPAEAINVLSGYAPGSFYAKETTIVRVP